MKPEKKFHFLKQGDKKQLKIFTIMISSTTVVWLLLAAHLHLATGVGLAYIAIQALLLAGFAYVVFLLGSAPEQAFSKSFMYVYLLFCKPLKIFSKPILHKGNSVAVIARYNEDVNWTRHLNTQVVIYNKGEADLNVDCRVIPRPNEGREAETYMHYIIDNYDSLPDFVIFLQGNPFMHNLFLLGELRAANGKLQFLGDTATENSNQLTAPKGMMQELTCQVLPKLSLGDTFTFSVGAQYIVPREMIVSKSLVWWQRVYSLHNAFDAILEFPPSLFGQLVNGHVMERIWSLIWEYTSPQETTRR